MHEIGHQLGLNWHDANGKSLHPQGFPNDIMASYTSIDIAHTVVRSFREMDIRNLRAEDVINPANDPDFD